MKKLLALLLSGVMVLSMIGCGNTQSKETTAGGTEAAGETEETKAAAEQPEEVELTFWHAMSGVNEEAMQKITDDFMTEYPYIKVTLVNQGGYLDLFDKLMASAKADQLPNMSQVYSNRLSWYVDKGLTLDLNPYINDPEIGLTEEDKADFPEMFMNDCIWGDAQYAMPFNKSQMVLYYNEGMLKEAGVEVPTTWDEWAAAAEKLTKDTDGDGEPDIYGMVFANNLSTDIAPWLKQAGGATMNEETNELYFDTPETKEAVEFLNSMFQNKTARFAGEDQNANIPVQQGRAAMCVASTSALPYIESGTEEGITINAAALPSYKTDDQLYYGTNVAAFNVGSDAQKEAVWLYLKFLTSTENTAYFASQTGYIPVRKSAQNDPVFAAVLAEKPIKQLSFDCMDRGFQGTRNIGGINALDALGDQLDLVFAGEKDIDTALKDAQANGEKAMEEARNN
ncbi:MAG: ABC transporter substrate-binding protein [Lachnospiraceae bacterium]